MMDVISRREIGNAFARRGIEWMKAAGAVRLEVGAGRLLRQIGKRHRPIRSSKSLAVRLRNERITRCLHSCSHGCGEYTACRRKKFPSLHIHPEGCYATEEHGS